MDVRRPRASYGSQGKVALALASQFATLSWLIYQFFTDLLFKVEYGESCGGSALHV
jgi:hypothetical protein